MSKPFANAQGKRAAIIAFIGIVCLIFLSILGTFFVLKIQARTTQLEALAEQQIEHWASIQQSLSYLSNNRYAQTTNHHSAPKKVQRNVRNLLAESKVLEQRITTLSSKPSNRLLWPNFNQSRDDIVAKANVSQRLQDNVSAFTGYSIHTLRLGTATWDSDLQISLLTGEYLTPLREMKLSIRNIMNQAFARSAISALMINLCLLLGIWIIWKKILAPAFDSLVKINSDLQHAKRTLSNLSNQFSTAFFAIREPACIVELNGAIKVYNEAFGSKFIGNSAVNSSIDVVLETIVDASGVQKPQIGTSPVEQLNILNGITTTLSNGDSVTWQSSKASSDTWLLMAIDQTEILLKADEAAHKARLHTLGRVSGEIAHDFNNILASIMGRIELIQLAERTDSKEGRNRSKQLTTVIDSCKRAASLIARLLHFAKRQPLQTDVVNCSAIAKKIKGDFLLDTNHITFHVEAEDNCFVLIDRYALITALENLIQNSMDSIAGEQGSITLKVNRLKSTDKPSTSDVVSLSVSDTGPGFAREALTHAVEPFYSTKHEKNGTGLGLSMVHGLVQQSGGEMHIENADTGAIVSLLFPSCEQKPESPEQLPWNMSEPLRLATQTIEHQPNRSAENDSQHKSCKHCVLLEDNIELSTVLQQLLRSLGYSVEPISTCREGVGLLNNSVEFDLAICDWQLQESTSSVFIEALMETENPAKIILMTGNATREITEFSDRYRINLLQKPVPVDKLVQALNEAV